MAWSTSNWKNLSLLRLLASAPGKVTPLLHRRHKKWIESTKLPKDCILCTLDVSSLYPKIQTEDGIYAAITTWDYGSSCACRTSTNHHDHLWGTIWASRISTPLHEHLGDANCATRASTSIYKLLTVANCTQQTSTSLLRFCCALTVHAEPQLFCTHGLNYPWGGRYRTTNRKPVVSM